MEGSPHFDISRRLGFVAIFRRAPYNCHILCVWCNNTGYTQNNGAVSIVFTIETAPFFCVYPVIIVPNWFRSGDIIWTHTHILKETKMSPRHILIWQESYFLHGICFVQISELNVTSHCAWYRCSAYSGWQQLTTTKGIQRAEWRWCYKGVIWYLWLSADLHPSPWLLVHRVTMVKGSSNGEKSRRWQRLMSLQFVE